jgi:hypothetical protein
MKVAILTAVLSTVVFNLIDRMVLSPGRFINHYFPCRQDPNTSFPCYGPYDITALIICGFIFIASLAIVLMFSVKKIIEAGKRTS